MRFVYAAALAGGACLLAAYMTFGIEPNLTSNQQNLSVVNGAPNNQAGGGNSIKVNYPDQSYGQTGQSYNREANAFLALHAKDQDLREKALRQRGLLADTEALSDLYDHANLPIPEGKDRFSDDISNRISKSLKTDTIQLLQALGFNAQKVRRLISMGANPIDAALAYVRGDTDPIQAMILSDSTVLASIADMSSDTSNDGYLSSAKLKVSKTLVESDNGKVDSIRLLSGIRPDGLRYSTSSEESLLDNTDKILFLSKSYYEQLAFENSINSKKNPESKPNSAVLIGAAYERNGDILIPVGNNLSKEGSYQALIAKSAYIN